MNVDIEETGPVERKLRIEIPTAEVDAEFEGVYEMLRKNARIQGFRPGKAPRSVLQRYYSEHASGEVLERLVQKSLPKAVEDSDLSVVGQPHLHPGDPPSEGEPFAYEAIFDIRPEIELKQVRGLEVRPGPLAEPEEDPIERHLEEARVRQSQLVEEDEGAAAARGHQIIVDYKATVAGEPFEGGSGQEIVVELGEGRAIEGLEEQLLGLAVGEERQFDLELPDTYPAEDVAGKTAGFEVKCVGLKRRELPELDDELAKDISDFDTLAELRADLEKRVEEGREQERERVLRDAALDAVIAANPFAVPQSLVEHQLQHRLDRAASQLGQLPQEQLSQLVEGWREEWRPHAEREVRMALLVPEIADQEKIEVDEGDIDAELQKEAERADQSLAQIKRSFREQGMLQNVESGLLEQRVVDFLLAEATVRET